MVDEIRLSSLLQSNILAGLYSKALFMLYGSLP